MEQENKKRRGRRRRESKSSLSFPIDLISEILLRLPERSIVRFRCVSKLWSSITTDPYFINLFETRSPRPSLLVICLGKDDKLYVSSIPQHTFTLHKNSNKSPYSSSQPIDSYHMKFTAAYSHMPPTESVNGLICFQESGNPVVWNPSKKQFLTLPKPRKSWNHLTVLLGYDPVEGKHKLVCLPTCRSWDVCRVLTLGSSAEESWRTVKTNHKNRYDFHSSGRCINGVIYYVAYSYHTNAYVVMSFDVRSEKSDLIELPSDTLICGNMLITYEGRLACLHSKKNSRLWILEDAGKHKWSSQDFLSPFRHYDPISGTYCKLRGLAHYNDSLRTHFKLRGFTHAGEFIFAPSGFCKPSYVLFYDPVRNSLRRFEFKGIPDDDRRVMLTHAFPNHIESQISLL